MKKPKYELLKQEPRNEDEDAERLADALARGKLRTAAQVEDMALALGCSEYELYRRQFNPRITRMTMDKIQTRTIYLAAACLDAIAAKAELGSVQAFRSLCQVGTIIPVGGVSFQQNTLIDARSSGQNNAGAEFARSFWKRIQESRNGTLQLVEPADADPEPHS